VPDRVLSNADLGRMVETTDEWIVERTGIRERRIAAPDQASSDLALIACQRALASAGLEPDAVDQIIVATTTPDRILPSCACTLQHKLGATRAVAFDMFAACTGFVFGLSIARSFIGVRTAETVLVVGVETLSRVVDYTDRNTCVLFGDGAGAVVLSADSKPGIHASVLHADGSQVDMLSVPGNVCKGRITGSPYLQMNGQGVFKYAVKVLDEVARETVAAAGMSLGDVDWLIPHQANVRILDATARKLGIPAGKLVVTVDHHGNTSAASVPLALDEFIRAGKIRGGHRVLMEGVGGGFTWGATLATL